MTKLSRRQFGRWAAAATGAISLGGCAPWEYADPQHGLDRLAAHDGAPTPLESRVLNRLGYGPRPGDLARLRSISVEAWIDRQLHPESIAESPELLAALGRLETLNLSPEEARDREVEWEPDSSVTPIWRKVVKFGKGRRTIPGSVMEQLAQATILRAAYSERALQEVMVEFWSDHFSINQIRGECRWLKPADDRQMRQFALGRFRDLLGASAHSAAMMAYLDNAENRKMNGATGGRPNENYARELLELHTLEDTSAYTLEDIQEVARALTGWMIGRSADDSWGEFTFRAADHDDDEKQILGMRFAAGGGQQDGEKLLDLLAAHRLTARAIAGKLCYRFLGVVPEPLRERLAIVFLESEGDIRAVLGELLQSDEFRTSPEPAFRRPFQFAISAMRALGARTSGAAIVAYLEKMGQRPFGHAQPDGYPTRPESWTAGLTSRWSFAIDLARNQIDETWINLEALERATSGMGAMKVSRLLADSVLPVSLTDEELKSLGRVVQQPVEPLPQCLALLLMSPQFQWC